MDGTSVVVADDHQSIRRGLRQMIEAVDALSFAGEAGGGRAAVDLIRARNPALALVDLRMPRFSGWDVLAAVRASDGITTAVVFFSAGDSVGMVQRALRQGAAGFISKSLSDEDVVQLLLRAARGKLAISSNLQEALTERIHGSRDEALSERELEVLDGMAEGKDGNAIATSLYLSSSTVRTHQRSIYKKLGTSTAGGAVAAAMRQGLME